MALIPRSRRVRFAAYIGRPDGQTWEDVTDALCLFEGGYGDTGLLGTGQTGADSCVFSATIGLRSSRIMLDAKLDTATVDEALVIGDEASVIGDSSDAGVKVLNALFPGTVTFHPGDSLHPRDKMSQRNQWQGTYSPLLAPGREIMVYRAITAPGAVAMPEDYFPIFHGVIGDSIKDDGSAVITLQCRDLSKRLADCYIETVRQYGSTSGKLAEEVIQQIITDNLGAPGSDPLDYRKLKVASSTTAKQFKVKPYQVEYGTVWDAIQQMATTLGWFLGYMYDDVDKGFKLTLLEPPRSKTTPDYSLTWTDDFYSHDMDLTDRHIRNAVKVSYRDANTGQRKEKVVEDLGSITSYGRRAMQIEEGDASLIDTEEEAAEFAGAALADLKDMTAGVTVEMPFFPQLGLFSVLSIEDPRIHTDNGLVAVNSISHRFSLDGDKATYRTTVSGCEKVIGGLNRWLVMQTRPGAPGTPTQGRDITTQVIIPAPSWIPESPTVGVDVNGLESSAYIIIGWKKPVGEYYPAKYYVRHKPHGTAAWSETTVGVDTVTTGLSTSPHIEHRITGLLPNIQYDVQVQPVSTEGVLGIALDLTSGAVTPKDSVAPPPPNISASGANGTLTVDCGSPGASDSDVRLCVVSNMQGFNPDYRVWFNTNHEACFYMGAVDGYSDVVGCYAYGDGVKYSNLLSGSTKSFNFPEYFGQGNYMYFEFWAMGTQLPTWQGEAEWVVKPTISATEYRRYLLKSDGQNPWNEYFKLFYEPTDAAWIRLGGYRIYKEGEAGTTKNYLGPGNVVATSCGKQTVFMFSSLDPGKTYYARACDIDTSKNTSAWSNEAISTIAHAAPLVISHIAAAGQTVLYSDYDLFYNDEPEVLLAPSYLQTYSYGNNASQSLRIWKEAPPGKTFREGFVPRVSLTSSSAVFNETWAPDFESTQDDTELVDVLYTPLTSVGASSISFNVFSDLLLAKYRWQTSEMILTVYVKDGSGNVLWSAPLYYTDRDSIDSYSGTAAGKTYTRRHTFSVSLSTVVPVKVGVGKFKTISTDDSGGGKNKVLITDVTWRSVPTTYTSTGDVQWIAINRS